MSGLSLPTQPSASASTHASLAAKVDAGVEPFYTIDIRCTETELKDVNRELSVNDLIQFFNKTAKKVETQLPPLACDVDVCVTICKGDSRVTIDIFKVKDKDVARVMKNHGWKRSKNWLYYLTFDWCCVPLPASTPTASTPTASTPTASTPTASTPTAPAVLGQKSGPSAGTSDIDDPLVSCHMPVAKTRKTLMLSCPRHG